MIRPIQKPTKRQTAKGSYTFADFCALVRDGQKADLLDGVIYLAAPDNTDNNDLFTWLYTIMHLYVRRRRLGKVFSLRVAFRLDDNNSPEPDIGFVKTENLLRVRRGYIDGPADVAIEIVSPDSANRDYEEKRAKFERFKVPEYWIIDEEKKAVTVLRLNERGTYREVRPRKGVISSRVLKGFWFKPDWLWEMPRPDELKTLKKILAAKA